jgi:hypothetical protein
MINSVLTARSERASRKMTYLLEQYAKSFPDEPLPLDPRKVARWAYEHGLWKPADVAPQEVLRRKLCRALRHSYVRDPQGREVRANFAAIEEVMTVDGPKRMSKWYPIFKAPAEVVRQALALDRKQALATVQQMKLDFDSYNENNEGHEVLPPLDLDFNKDLEEMSLPTDYDPDPYGDEDDDE